MTTTAETPVDGHGTDLADLVPFRPIVPRQTGPSTPIEPTQPLPTVGSTPEPAPAGDTGHRAQPEQTSTPEPVERPEEPPLPELPPNPDEDTHPFRVDRVYWGHKALVAVYWIAILTGAIGQIVFFGSLFGLGAWGYAAAAVIATTAETVMVSSGDTALKHRIANQSEKRRWLPFLLVSFTAAAAASGMNLSHFWHLNISLAVLFGGVSLLGYLLHIIDGFVQGSDYLDRKDTYDRAVAERDRQARQRAEARYERQLAELESAREAARRAAEHAEQAGAETTPAPPEPAPEPEPPAKPAASRKSATGKAQQTKTASQRFDRDTALRVLGDEFWDLGPAEINSRMAGHGYQPINSSTIRRWRKDGDR